MYKNGDTCPLCAEGHLSKTTKDKTVSYKDNKLKLEDFVVYYCSECEDSVVSKQSMKEFEKTIRDFHRSIDGLLTSKEIKKIRIALGFNTQESFADFLGLAKKTFARYESGTVTQNRATDHLLRLLFDDPEKLKLLRGDADKGISLEKGAEDDDAFFYNASHSSSHTLKYNVGF